MIKTILNLNGAQKLTKTEQRSINGGKWNCGPRIDGPGRYPCPDGYYCDTSTDVCKVELLP